MVFEPTSLVSFDRARWPGFGDICLRRPPTRDDGLDLCRRHDFSSDCSSEKIVLKRYGAQPVTANRIPACGIVQDLALRANLPMPKVYVIPEDAPNAFATGRNPAHASGGGDPGIRRILTKRELAGVLGHELTHVVHRDILISTIAATLAGAIGYLAHMAQWGAMFGMGRDRDRDEGGGIFGLLFMIIVAPLAAMLIQMAVSRSREYMADEGGAKISGDPLALADALRKLEMGAQNIPMQASDATANATAHMFIVNPLSASGIANLFSTNPADARAHCPLGSDGGKIACGARPLISA